ncbi:hypothetical protein K490DRAFT_45887 [Saccharata proteae CBS 121410]|uniref:EDC4-like protein pdc1 beta-propeller domain-containing protein n=1 Tax=Saccharata proteae CBS 121410 TaxID=1314787 RepID=A0A9P4HV56_9PEZI|nr:hypothetical protein K490DRAFT_45887 [Saccharata proteae CBS 121410]
MADLQELFARLKSPSNAATSPGAQQQTGAQYHQPSVSSPIFSPPPPGSQPHSQSAIMSPNTSVANTPAPEPSNSDRTASLLNLLKFNQSGGPSSSLQEPAAERRPSSHIIQDTAGNQQGAHGRAISASDLVASFMRKPQSSAPAQAPSVASPAPIKPSENLENPQDLLLRLLNHPKPAQNDSPSVAAQSIETDAGATKVEDLAQNLADTKLERVDRAEHRQATESPFRVFGSGESAQPTAFQVSPAASKNSIFTYINPFEQLSASSPRNRTPKPDSRSATASPKIDILKHGRDTPSGTSAAAPASKSRKLSPNASPSPARQPHEPETVAEAVGQLGKEVDKEVTEAIAEMDIGSGSDKNAQAERLAEQKDLEKAVHDVAVEVQENLEDRKTRKDFEKNMPKDLSRAIESVVDDIAQEKVADSWESAEDSGGKDEANNVHVFNFPMKPFVSIDIKKLRDPPTSIRQENIMDIARLKKDFDQIDRNLVTVSKTFIAYGLSKNGGFRLIRQDTGKYKQVWNSTKERIFNLQICSAAAPSSSSQHEMESIVATGVDGSVFWSTIVSSDGDTFTDDNLENMGFVFPPVPAQDDNTSGGQLKTRAKKSQRHPEFFGVGRGKSIFLVLTNVARWPEYTDPKTRICDSEKYLQERCLRIVTGKAGKDFAFSEDDTVIASLDKAGRLRFWDIRELLVDTNDGRAGRIPPKEVRTPLLQLNTVAAGDKSWPTSVFFLDKERPCTKGIALRYLIVGLKQNHTLQLWDIALGKPVQEINFPHENESDAICSIAYHPRTGILAVGHPTRNSIYFIHLSAPRYNLPPMTQAKFLSRLTDTRDTDLPRPESTAIMSGIREFSFASKGQLRSLEMLNEPAAAPDSYGPDEAPLFELYIMHSKGVTCLGIRKDDLGWSKENKVLHPVDAEKHNHIVINPIRVASDPDNAASTAASSVNGEAVAAVKSAPVARAARPAVKEIAKKESSGSRGRAPSQTPETASMIASTLERVEEKQDAVRAAIINGNERAEKKKKKRASASDPIAQAPPAAEISRPLEAAKILESETPEWATRLLSQIHTTAQAPAASTGVDLETLKTFESSITAEFSKTLNKELETIYRRFDEDKRVQDAAGAAKMDAVLRLVSSTLTDNVEKTLSRIVTQNIQKIILPSLTELVAATIDRRLTEILAQSVQASIPREVKSALPSSINTALRDPEVLRLISDLVASKVSGHIDTNLSGAVRNNVGSTFSNIAVSAAQQMAGDLDRRVGEQLRQAELARQRDASKIDRLSNLVNGLAETLHTMSASQASFQDEILKLQKQISQLDVNNSSLAQGTVRNTPTPVAKSDAELELEHITRLMTEGNHEEATIMWLQSPRQSELFDSLFVRCNPAYIQSLSPLVALSVSAAVSASLETHVMERLHWLDAVFSNINPRDSDILEVAPKIMDVLSTRLQGAYMTISEQEPTNPILKRISALARRAVDLKNLAG